MTEHLKFTKNRNFMQFNLYTRAPMSMEEWEQEYLRECVGGQYEEDKQSYKRLQDWDARFGTDYAEYYKYFHFLWYYDNNKEPWACELRNSRVKDIFINSMRESFFETTIEGQISSSTAEKDSNVIPFKRRKSNYSESDYQPNFSYNSNWEDILIMKIDEERKNNSL